MFMRFSHPKGKNEGLYWQKLPYAIALSPNLRHSSCILGYIFALREKAMSIYLNDILFLMIASLFLMGMITFCAGVIVLLRRTMGQEIRTLATQTNRLAEKGVLDGVAGLVGNTSALLEATNQLVRTAAGIGIFLIFVGLGLISASIFILIKVP
jgi:hypothetical protein